MRRSLGPLAILAAALVAAPAAQGAERKLYRVSLTGKDTADVTRSWAVPPNSERCTGTVRDTRRLAASFGVAPVRTRALAADPYWGWLHFKARITSPRYTYRRDTSGDWGIDLGEDPELYPRQPGECEFTHEHTNLECSWFARTSMLNCRRNENLQLIEHGPPRTKLRVAAVKRLGRGQRARVSGTMEMSYDYDSDDPEVDEHHRGQERFRYTLTVTRVR